MHMKQMLQQQLAFGLKGHLSMIVYVMQLTLKLMHMPHNLAQISNVTVAVAIGACYVDCTYVDMKFHNAFQSYKGVFRWGCKRLAKSKALNVDCEQAIHSITLQVQQRKRNTAWCKLLTKKLIMSFHPSWQCAWHCAINKIQLVEPVGFACAVAQQLTHLCISWNACANVPPMTPCSILLHVNKNCKQRIDKKLSRQCSCGCETQLLQGAASCA